MMEANLDTGGPRNVTDGEIIFLLNISVPHVGPVGCREEFLSVLVLATVETDCHNTAVIIQIKSQRMFHKRRVTM